MALWLAEGARRGDAGTLAPRGRRVPPPAPSRLRAPGSLDEAARACGSHPFATGGGLDRVRRDLELFVLQHRLDPIVARAGAAALEEAR